MTSCDHRFTHVMVVPVFVVVGVIVVAIVVVVVVVDKSICVRVVG